MEPAGFAELPPHRADKVRLGNALAEVSCRLASAQEKAGNFWTLVEQPATSLMWLYEPVAELINKPEVYVAKTDVCMFGAPWRKPTSIAANFLNIMRLQRTCNGKHSHISLQGTAPCGKSWTAIASPYWPEFAKQWVRACKSLYVEDDMRLPPLHSAGFASVSPDTTVEDLLNDMGYVQPSGKETSTTALRVSAGIQPTGDPCPNCCQMVLGQRTM